LKELTVDKVGQNTDNNYGMMLSMGPGFSAEMVLLKW
jgi:predicted naringenin-chalcone synthase